MGCPPRFTSDGKEWVSPVITDPDQVDRLSIPDVREGRTGDVLQAAERILAETPDVLVTIPDTAAPLSIAELMWDGTFYEAMLDAPEAVHALLDKITDFTVRFTREFQCIVGNRLNPCPWPGVWADGPGCYLGDDAMSLVSPAAHAEFSVPTISRIARECGPLYYHSCTWRRGYFPNILAIENVALYNWNPGNSDDTAVILREFAGKAVMAPHLTRGMHADDDALKLGRGFANEVALFEYMLDSVPDNGCVFFYFSDVCDQRDLIEPIYDLLDARGHTPQAWARKGRLAA